MGYSSLISSKVLTNNCYSGRKHAIDTITPHYMCWYTDGATCARSFVPSSRQASSNYCIGKSGDIVLSVDESNHPWTSGNYANDDRAITIECANYMDNSNGHVYGQLPDATWSSLVALCVDICKRLGKKRLVYKGSANYSGLSSTDMLLTKHKWFQDTDCPGPWFDKQFDRLATEVTNKITTGGNPQPASNPENSYGLNYRAHVQTYGWLSAVRDGQIAGTTGLAKRLEAFKITPPDGVELNVTAHLQTYGDRTYNGIKKGQSSGTSSSTNDPIIGTTGESKRIEGIKIDVVKNDGPVKGKTLYYRLHLQSTGWTNWVPQGTFCGTRGQGKRVEAIQMKFDGGATTKVTKINIADVAAKIHYDMVTDNRNGYSQAPTRWGGDYGGTKTLTINGRDYTYKLGSYDCSSSTITAWKLALKYTPYEGKLDAATYTGDMKKVFVNSGLFTASLTNAKRGDLYLAEGKHVAMCQDGGHDGVFGYDCLSEFNRNENRGATYGKPGDQDGYEAVMRGYYDDGWNTVLHYNGKADYEVRTSTEDIRYSAHCQTIGWQSEVKNGQTAGTTGQAKRLEALKINPPEGMELSAVAHIQTYGNRTYNNIKNNSGVVIGTTGESKRLEAITLKCVKNPKGLKLKYQGHMQTYGWGKICSEGELCGTTGQGKRLEAIKIWFE